MQGERFLYLRIYSGYSEILWLLSKSLDIIKDLERVYM